MRPKQLIELSMSGKMRAALSDTDWKIGLDITQDTIEIFLHGSVGDASSGTDSGHIGSMLAANRGKPLTMFVNSPGGLAYDGVALYNALASHGGPTTAIIEGLAGSAASLAVLGCDNIRAHEMSTYHPHYCLGMAFGHAADIRNALASMDLLDRQLEQAYQQATGLPLETIKAHLLGPDGDGTPFSAAEAKAHGYIHSIVQKKNTKPPSQHVMAANIRQQRLRVLKNMFDSRGYIR